MDSHPFDALTRVLHTSPSRRALVPLLGSALGVPLFRAAPAAAKKKKKKTTLCLEGQTIQASKKKKKKLLKSGATPGACPAPPPPPGCTPNCPANACGGADGCGGTCGCAAGSLCHAGVCQSCTVTCNGNSAACGSDLNIRLAGGGTVYACPGRYVGNFTIGGNVALIGAGQGEDPSVDTILDAITSGRVVQVNLGVSAALQGLRITGGKVNSENGGGIRNQGTLIVTECTIDNNFAAFGGGIDNAFEGTSLTLNRCTVSRNRVVHQGAGIYTEKDLIINGSAITGNDAGSAPATGFGGGLYVASGPVTFDVSSSVTGNTCGVPGCAGGIHNFDGTVDLNNANVSGNTPPQCFQVPDC